MLPCRLSKGQLAAWEFVSLACHESDVSLEGIVDHNQGDSVDIENVQDFGMSILECKCFGSTRRHAGWLVIDMESILSRD